MEKETSALAVCAATAATSLVTARKHSLVEKYATNEHHSIVAAQGPFEVLSLSSDARVLAGAAGNVLCVWDTVGCHRTHRLVFREDIAHLAIAADGHELVVADLLNSLYLVELATATRCHLIDAPQPLTALSMASSAGICLFGTADRFIHVLDMRTGRTFCSFETVDVVSRLFVDVHDDLVFASQKEGVAVHRLSSGILVATYGDGQQPSAEIPPRKIVIEGNSETCVIDSTTGQIVGTFDVLFDAMDYTPDGEYIVAAGSHYLRRWNGHSEQLEPRTHTYISTPTAVKISSDGELFYVSGDEATIDVRTRSGKWRGVLADIYCPIMGASMMSDNKHLIVADEQGFVVAYDVESGSVARHQIHETCVSKLRTYGTWIATGSYDGTAVVFDAESHEVIRRVSYGDTPIQAVALVGHEFLITGNAIGAVHCHDIGSGEVVSEFAGNTSAVRSVCASPCGRYLLTTADNGDVLLFDYETTTLLHSLSHINVIYEACFDESGDSFFFGDNFGTLKKVDSGSGAITARWNALPSDVRSVTLHSDRLCAIGLHHDAVILDTTTGSVLLRTSPDNSLRRRVAFLNAAGTRFVTGGQDGRLRFHCAETGGVVAELHHPTDGFLWTATGLSDESRGDWFWTDRPELIDVRSCTDGTEVMLEPEDARRKEYVRIHNSRAATMASVGMSERATKRNVNLLAQAHRSALEESRQMALLEHFAS